MIVVRVIGGIGNQIFQFLFGQYLEEIFKQPVYYDIRAFETVSKERLFELKILFPHIRLYAGKEFEFSQNTKIKRKILILLFKLKRKNHYISESTFDLQKSLKVGETYYFDGYWQEPEIINEIFLKYKEFFDLGEILPKELKGIAKEINSSNAVSIHVRRGDYFTPKYIKTYGVCSKGYYEKAIAEMEKIGGEKIIFFIFSDDLEWVKSHLQLPVNIVLVPNLEINNYWYIYLMSLCKHNIMSNSSFSWWGAYINSNPNKIVISPKHWTLNSDDSLALNDWIKL